MLLTLLISGATFAQIRTTETRSTKDTTINGVTTTVTTTISETEDITPHNNMLTVSPVKYIVFYNLTYYRKLSDMWVIGAGLSGPTFGGKIDNSTSIGGYGINLEARYYPKGTAPLGFYIAPNFYYNTVSVTDGTNYEYLWMTGGILLGFQFFPTQDFSVGCGIGVDYFVPTEKRDGQTVSADNQDILPGTRMLPAIRFDFGYAWK
jgi:hypothetical protein